MIRPQFCPICEKSLSASTHECVPFCSQRCRQIDLLRWTKGEYAIVNELDPREAELLKAVEEGEIPPELLD